MRPFITKQMIDKAKKKLKKLQKRQRKQDAQGVSNTADQWPSDTLDKFLAGQNEPYVINMIKHAKITEEMMDVVRERYGITKESIINAPVITERLDVSDRPIVYDMDMKPVKPSFD
jgi:hypothetical protein